MSIANMLGNISDQMTPAKKLVCIIETKYLAGNK